MKIVEVYDGFLLKHTVRDLEEAKYVLKLLEPTSERTLGLLGAKRIYIEK